MPGDQTEDRFTINRYISDENMSRIGKLKNILKNQKLFAETMLVNVHTGK